MHITENDMEYDLLSANRAIADATTAKQLHNVPGKLMVVVNYREPSYKKRLYVVDTETGEIIRAHHVAHGSASTCTSNVARACYFSNVVGSRKSSLGAMKTGKIYYGKYGKSLKLHGLDKCNSMVYARFIVMHSSAYVTDQYILKNGYAGRSWGCLAVDTAVSSALIDLVADGTFVYAYY